MLAVKYIKIPAVYKRLKEAEQGNRVIYVSGATGFGKTAAVEYFLRRKRHLIIEGSSGSLSSMPVEEDLKEKILVVDGISWITDETSKSYILEQLYRREKQIILIGRGQLPAWLKLASVEKQFLYAGERDMLFGPEEIRRLFEAGGVELEESELNKIYVETTGYALALIFTMNHMAGRKSYTKAVIEAVRRDIYQYFDHSIFEKWSPQMREVLLSMCPYPQFTVEMVEMVTGSSQVPALLEQAMSVGTFLKRYDERHYGYRELLRGYFQWKQALSYTKEQLQENYQRGAAYYEKRDRIEDALRYYELAGNQEKISELLIKNAARHPGTGHFFETRKYYFSLPQEMVEQSAVLMSGMSMLHTMLLQPDESERWYRKLVEYEAKAPKGSPEKKEAKVRIAYLDIGLAHRGIHGIIDILRNAAYLAMNKKICLPEFSVTSNLPSIMNGGLDFSEWSKHDKELSLMMKKPLEVVLGKGGVGLVNVAMAESGFEKATMDVYEVLTRLNTGYMSADSGGKIEICFAAVGLLVKVHMALGQPQIAENISNSFLEKIQSMDDRNILPNLQTLRMWQQMQQGDLDAVRTWLEEAPDENVEFHVLERYRYLNKVRALIALGEPAAAIGLIERLNFYFVRYERHYMWMENQVLKAIVQYRLGREEWEDTLNRALEKVEYYHFIRIVSQEGIAIKPLLQKLRRPAVSKAFFRLLEDEVSQRAIYYPNYLKEEKSVDTGLTSMEKRILKLLCENISSEEICSLCNFTYSTLKFHNRNIYKKLGVKNRKEAEYTAKRLGLVRA